MTSIFMLIGCLLSFEEYDSLQKELLDTAYFEDTSEQGSTESPKYIYLGEDTCLGLSRNNAPFHAPPWSFSFRVTKDQIEENRVYSLFSTESHSILMKYSNEGEVDNSSYLGITVCPHQEVEVCYRTYLERPLPTYFEAGDRITISVGAENAEGVSPIRIYQQDSAIAEIADFQAPRMETSELSFGCRVNDLPDIFGTALSEENSDLMGTWKAGVDSLILFDKELDDTHIQSIIEDEDNNSLSFFLKELSNEGIDISYWNLGEDIPPDVIDSIGDRDGKVQGEDYSFRNHD